MTTGPSESACWALMRLAAYGEAALGECGLTSRQYRMLILIAEAPISATELARRIGVAPPSATLMVSGLIRRQIVRRRLSSEDQRRVWLSLTPEGAALLEQAERAVAERLKEIASGFGSAGAKELERLAGWNRPLDTFRPRWMARQTR